MLHLLCGFCGTLLMVCLNDLLFILSKMHQFRHFCVCVCARACVHVCMCMFSLHAVSVFVLLSVFKFEFPVFQPMQEVEFMPGSSSKWQNVTVLISKI